MNRSRDTLPSIRVHLTNVTGLGAVRLAQSLLPALEASSKFAVSEIYLPNKGEILHYKAMTPGLVASRYYRVLPNSISRVLECTFFASRFNGNTPILVLGDLPLSCKARQTLFLQTIHLTNQDTSHSFSNLIKFFISKLLFKLNIGHIENIIVQSEEMKSAVINTYPQLLDKIYIIPQPVPFWLTTVEWPKPRPNKASQRGLKLFYPAANYPHKNHELLSLITSKDSEELRIEKLTLTIDNIHNPNSGLAWIECTGLLHPMEMLEVYRECDGLLFLSKAESYGFPIIEAMWVGLPIICPDLPYAKSLCGTQGIYFNPSSPESLKQAICILNQRLDSGWSPDWSHQLQQIPRDWNQVADAMGELTLDGFNKSGNLLATINL